MSLCVCLSLSLSPTPLPTSPSLHPSLFLSLNHYLEPNLKTRYQTRIEYSRVPTCYSFCSHVGSSWPTNPQNCNRSTQNHVQLVRIKPPKPPNKNKGAGLSWTKQAGLSWNTLWSIRFRSEGLSIIAQDGDIPHWWSGSFDMILTYLISAQHKSVAFSGVVLHSFFLGSNMFNHDTSPMTLVALEGTHTQHTKQNKHISYMVPGPSQF